ncbi:MAG: hypothetical protein ACLFPV_11865 [Spirochaetaceae bacterium]
MTKAVASLWTGTIVATAVAAATAIGLVPWITLRALVQRWQQETGLRTYDICDRYGEARSKDVRAPEMRRLMEAVVNTEARRSTSPTQATLTPRSPSIPLPVPLPV